MICSELALRYAKALFKLSSSTEELKKWSDDLNQLNTVLNKTPALMQFFRSPETTQQEKEQVIRSGFGKYLDSGVTQFLIFLLAKRRFQYLPLIIQQYGQIVREVLGILEGHLTTAVPIEGLSRDQLVHVIEEKYKKKLLLEEEIDPKLIGGGVLTIDNWLVDFSIRTKLADLKKSLGSHHDT